MERHPCYTVYPNVNAIGRWYEEENKNSFLLCKKGTQVTHTWIFSHCKSSSHRKIQGLAGEIPLCGFPSPPHLPIISSSVKVSRKMDFVFLGQTQWQNHPGKKKIRKAQPRGESEDRAEWEETLPDSLEHWVQVYYFWKDTEVLIVLSLQ